MPLRVLWLCLALALLVGWGSASGAPPPVASAETLVGQQAEERQAEERPVVRALGKLRRWDARRASAYAAGDPGRLRRLYAPGSLAGARDVRMLRSYAERGLVVEGLTVQVLAVRLLDASATSVRLRILDRVTTATVVPTAGRGRATLPAGRPERRVVTMVDLGEGWVVRAVRRG